MEINMYHFSVSSSEGYYSNSIAANTVEEALIRLLSIAPNSIVCGSCLEIKMYAAGPAKYGTIAKPI